MAGWLLWAPIVPAQEPPWLPLLKQGTQLREKAHYREGEEIYLRAREEARAGGGDELAAAVEDRLGSLEVFERRLGKEDPAVAHYRRAAQVFEKAYGPRHPELASVLNNWSLLCLAERRPSRSQELIERAVSIWQQVLGPDELRTMPGVENLTALLSIRGRLEEAEGGEHPWTALSANNLGINYLRQRRSAEAEPLLRRALTVWEKTLGPAHGYVSRVLLSLGTLHYEQGHYGEAEELFWKALQAGERALNPNHPGLAPLLDSHATALAHLGRKKEARELRSRAQKINAEHARANQLDLSVEARDLGFESGREGRR